MKSFIRRSNLIVPITTPGISLPASGSPEGAGPPAPGSAEDEDRWLHAPDAVTLDLEDGVSQGRKAEARALVKEALPLAGRGAAEVFVRVNAPYLYADLEASVWPGLTGIMLPKAERASDVVQASEMLEEMERRHGVEVGSLEIIVLLESALGVWNVREIITASPRVTQVALGEEDLSCDLGIAPAEEYDPFVYARGRIVIEGTAAGVQPLGMAYPGGTMPFASMDRDELLRLAKVGRNLGYKGVICPHSSWVEPVNTSFTPTAELVEYYTQVREVFAQAIAAGTAAIPFHGRMIDVPVDEWAKVVLAVAASCATRDEEKRRALEGPP
jgi:citrate lyase subunit beta/citryl-CoA lyase